MNILLRESCRELYYVASSCSKRMISLGGSKKGALFVWGASLRLFGEFRSILFEERGSSHSRSVVLFVTKTAVFSGRLVPLVRFFEDSYSSCSRTAVPIGRPHQQPIDQQQLKVFSPFGSYIRFVRQRIRIYSACIRLSVAVHTRFPGFGDLFFCSALRSASVGL